jgi:hypothetical protein
MIRWLRRQFVAPFKPIKRPAFPVCSELEAEAQAIRLREKLGDPKPLWRKKQRPVDYEDLPV